MTTARATTTAIRLSSATAVPSHTLKGMDSDVLVGFLVVAGVIALVIVGVRSGRRRNAAIRNWAQENGWSYTKSDHQLNNEWRVPIARSGTVDRLLQKPFPEGEAFSFDNTYRTGNGPALHRNINGLDLGVLVPTILILQPDRFEITAPKYTPVEFDDAEFNAQWRVGTQHPQDVAAAQQLLTPGFRQRLLGDDGLLRIRSELAFDDHYLLLSTGGEMQLGNVQPASDLLRGLARELPHP